MWRRMLDGLRHARERPPAVRALVTMCVFSIFGAAQMALYPLFASDVHDKPTRAFTTIVVASGDRRRRRRGRQRIPADGARACAPRCSGSSASASRRSASPWPAPGRCCLAFAVVVGFCYFSMTTALNTMLQHLADDEQRGRIMSLFVVTWGGVIPIGAIFMGAAADATSAPFVVAFGASVCLALRARADRAWSYLGRTQPSTAPLR